MPEATTGGRVRATVGVRELKNQLSSYLERVKAGEEITVTQYGTPIARLCAVGAEADQREALIEAGIIVAAERTSRHIPSRRAKLAPGEPIHDLVADQRR